MQTLWRSKPPLGKEGRIAPNRCQAVRKQARVSPIMRVDFRRPLAYINARLG